MSIAGEPEDDRPNRRCMVKLGVRVIHKVTPDSRCTELPCGVSNPSIMMPKTLRLRLSPKAIASKFTAATVTTSTDDRSEATGCNLGNFRYDEIRNLGSMSRVDVERGRVEQVHDGQVSNLYYCVQLKDEQAVCIF